MFEPWFGAFPPRLTKAEERVVIKTRLGVLAKRALEHWSVVSFLLLVGIIGYWLTRVSIDEFHEVGTAMMVASILGITVDFFLKRSIAKNAIKEAIGYTLPPELRNGMRWLYEQRFLEFGSTVTINISEYPNEDIVKLEVSYSRRLRNFTDRIQTISPLVEIMEGLIPERQSRILMLAYSIKGHQGVTVPSSQDKFEPNPSQKGKANALGRMSNQKETIMPNGEITIDAKYEIYKHRTDIYQEVLINTTQNPRVIIHVPDSLEAFVSFGNDEQGKTKRIENIWDLEGTLLPFQAIEIRWWDKKAIEKLKNG